VFLKLFHAVIKFSSCVQASFDEEALVSTKSNEETSDGLSDR
jgi:hypothetical protein